MIGETHDRAAGVSMGFPAVADRAPAIGRRIIPDAQRAAHDG